MPATSHLALAFRNWSLDLFPHPLEPSFLLYPLDRDETLLLLMRAIIPRKVSNLWIAVGLVTRYQLPARSDWAISRNISRNMQESDELKHEPLLLVVLPCRGGCLINGRFDESTRHSRYLSQNTMTCSQCYPQKMWNGISQAKLPAMEWLQSTSRALRLLTDWIASSQNYALGSPGVRLPHPAPFRVAQRSMTKLVRHRGSPRQG